MLLCLVCLFDLPCFFIPSFSHLSLKHVYTLKLMFIQNCVKHSLSCYPPPCSVKFVTYFDCLLNIAKEFTYDNTCLIKNMDIYLCVL